MKKITLLLFISLTHSFALAQNEKKSYSNTAQQTVLNLTDNNYFSYQDLSGLIKNYTRGEWKQEKYQIILTETFHSPIAENDYSIKKAPKFDYKTGTKRSIFKIDENQLILISEETEPENAIFPVKLSEIFILQ